VISLSFSESEAASDGSDVALEIAASSFFDFSPASSGWFFSHHNPITLLF